MKVLTVRQPWASAIMSGAKTVENRTWMPQRIWEPGDRIAIHAGAAIDREAPAFLLDAEHLRDRGVVLGAIAGFGLAVARVGAPVGALVEQEDLQQRPVPDRAVDPLGLDGAAAHRHVLAESPPGAGGQALQA